MKKIILSACALFTLAACSTVPSGPSVLVLQGSTKTFEEFRHDESYCRDYALQKIGGQSAGKMTEQSTVKNAAISTAVGAASGAAIGRSEGAAIGAGIGLLFGSASGAEYGKKAGNDAQTSYDNAYIQCMYGSGHRVPVPAGMMPTQERQPPPPVSTTPPPPPPQK